MAIVYNITNLTQFKTLIRSLEKRLIWSFCVRLDENLFFCWKKEIKNEHNAQFYTVGCRDNHTHWFEKNVFWNLYFPFITTLHFHIVRCCFLNKIEERDFCFVVKALLEILSLNLLREIITLISFELSDNFFLWMFTSIYKKCEVRDL